MTRAVRNSGGTYFLFPSGKRLRPFTEPHSVGSDERCPKGIRDQIYPPFGSTAPEGHSFAYREVPFGLMMCSVSLIGIVPLVGQARNVRKHSFPDGIRPIPNHLLFA